MYRRGYIECCYLRPIDRCGRRIEWVSTGNTQASAPRGDRLGTILGPEDQPVVKGREPGGFCVGNPPLERLISIVEGAVGRTKGERAGECPVRHRRQRVDVRRRSLYSLARVLLDRRISRRQHLRVLPLPCRHACRTEVDQYRFAVGRSNHDVGRLDVAVQIAVLVHVRQPVQQRVQPPPPFVGGQPPARVQDRLERLALDVLHNDVRGVVRVRTTANAHDVGMVQLGEETRLIDEPVEAPGESLLLLRRRRDYAPTRHSRRHFGGKVLLESDRSVQLVVERQVRDAEAAGAEHADDLVLVDPVSLRQRVRMGVRHDVRVYYS